MRISQGNNKSIKFYGGSWLRCVASASHYGMHPKWGSSGDFERAREQMLLLVFGRWLTITVKKVEEGTFTFVEGRK